MSATNHVYREICVSGEEVEQLTRIAETLQRLAEMSGSDLISADAQLLVLLRRRFERQEPIELGPSLHVIPAERRVEKPAAPFPLTALPARAAGFSTRPTLELIPGGAA